MKTFRQYLDEKRSNANRNPKTDVYEEIQALFARLGAIKLTEQSKYYFSFTDVNKLGVNPGFRL